MQTRTMAEDYKKIDAYVNSVNTVWITDKNLSRIRQKKKIGITLPFSCKNGAARVCEPTFAYTEDGKEPVSGKFLKDFKPIQWQKNSCNITFLSNSIAFYNFAVEIRKIRNS